MDIVRNNGVRLIVRDDGPRDGRIVMFSNSLGTDLRVWDPLIAELPQNLRIIRYDKRGHGLSSSPPAPYSMGALVKDAEALLDQGGPIGRKLDFLMQEFMREANTLCSKANASDLTQIGLDLKVVIDQMREQVQNLE